MQKQKVQTILTNILAPNRWQLIRWTLKMPTSVHYQINVWWHLIKYVINIV